MVIEFGEDIIVIDCGVQFPTEGMFGIDLVIPNISYLQANSNRIRAILITHGHEDHIGALPFVLPFLQTPVYAPLFANALIRAKLFEHPDCINSELYPITPGIPYDFGSSFQVTWFQVTHSIPDSMGLIIETPIGTIIHTGDFKLDHIPVDQKTMDLDKLALHGSKGVLILCSDSTYAEVEGFTPSEHLLKDSLNKYFGDASGRIFVATFASLISRIQQIIDVSSIHNRKICFVGRSMVDNVSMAKKMGYLNIPENASVTLNEARSLSPQQIVYITTGSQGEPTSALSRIANQDHREIVIQSNDTVILSASPIPGNELLVNRNIDNLLRQGAKVVYDKNALVHVHGHASREELKIVLGLTKPDYFIPVHGEYRHLRAHAGIAWDMGVGDKGIYILEDGDVLEVSELDSAIVGSVPADPIFIDGDIVHKVGSVVLSDRQVLASYGTVTIVVTIDQSRRQLIGDPKVIQAGFMGIDESQWIFATLVTHLKDSISLEDDFWDDLEIMKSKLGEIAGEYLFSKTRRRPIIVPIINPSDEFHNSI